MTLHEVEVSTPKAIALNLLLANGKSINCPAGGKVRMMLTGDEIGRAEATIEAARRTAKRDGALDAEVLGGGVKVLTKGYGEEAVPGTKKHRLEHPEEYDGGGEHVSAKKPHKAAKTEKAEK